MFGFGTESKVDIITGDINISIGRPKKKSVLCDRKRSRELVAEIHVVLLCLSALNRKEPPPAGWISKSASKALVERGLANRETTNKIQGW